MSEKVIRPIRLKRSTMDPSFVSSASSSSALVKVKLEQDKHVDSSSDNNNKALVAVKLEKEESGLLVTTTTTARRTLKRKRLSELVEKSRRFAKHSFEKQRTSQRGLTTRWSTER